MLFINTIPNIPVHIKKYRFSSKKLPIINGRILRQIQNGEGDIFYPCKRGKGKDKRQRLMSFTGSNWINVAGPKTTESEFSDLVIRDDLNYKIGQSSVYPDTLIISPSTYRDISQLTNLRTLLTDLMVSICDRRQDNDNIGTCDALRSGDQLYADLLSIAAQLDHIYQPGGKSTHFKKMVYGQIPLKGFVTVESVRQLNCMLVFGQLTVDVISREYVDYSLNNIRFIDPMTRFCLELNYNLDMVLVKYRLWKLDDDDLLPSIIQALICDGKCNRYIHDLGMERYNQTYDEVDKVDESVTIESVAKVLGISPSDLPIIEDIIANAYDDDDD